MKTKIISPKSDFCMKELFENEKIRRHFISDILGIPLERIKTVRLMNTFLWRRYRKQKLGILDVLVELNDETKINIEIQLKASAEWDKRQIFYLAKLFAAELRMGEDYKKLKKCVSISILDFNLTDRKENHCVYLLRDEHGNSFSDMLEIHTLELRKKLSGNEPVDDWIQFFNAENKEDLDMIRTKNEGILEAIRELKEISLGKRLRLIHEARLKAIRDENAIRDYEHMEGRKMGIEEGRTEGIQALILDNLEEQKTKEQILTKLEKRFSLSREEAEKYFQKYSAENK